MATTERIYLMVVCNSWRVVAIGSFNSGIFTNEIATMGFAGIGDDGSASTPTEIDKVLPTFNAIGTGVNGTTTNTSVNYGYVGLQPSSNLATQNVIIEAMYAYILATRPLQASAFSWKEIRLSAIKLDGSVLNGATVATLNTPQLGSGVGESMPPQNAVVTSLRTGGRGPHNRGRIYVPLHTSALVASFAVTTATQTTLRNASKAYIDTVNALNGDVRATVVSRTKGTYSDIVSVRTGNFVDTQRRRRNGVRETYISSVVSS